MTLRMRVLLSGRNRPKTVRISGGAALRFGGASLLRRREQLSLCRFFLSIIWLRRWSTGPHRPALRSPVPRFSKSRPAPVANHLNHPNPKNHSSDNRPYRCTRESTPSSHTHTARPSACARRTACRAGCSCKPRTVTAAGAAAHAKPPPAGKTRPSPPAPRKQSYTITRITKITVQTAPCPPCRPSLLSSPLPLLGRKPNHPNHPNPRNHSADARLHHLFARLCPRQRPAGACTFPAV
jgi:hypothetical protein